MEDVIMANEYGKDIITLTDEDGKELQFEHYNSVEMDGTVYVGLIEIFDDPKKQLESDGTLFILKTVEDDTGEEILVTIDDEELARVSPSLD
jgi:uncharacterized protein YrzB (UPF0473 family)